MIGVRKMLPGAEVHLGLGQQWLSNGRMMPPDWPLYLSVRPPTPFDRQFTVIALLN